MALRFSEPVSSKALDQVKRSLQNLVVPNDLVAKKMLHRFKYTLTHFQDMQFYAPSDEALDRIQHQLESFQQTLLQTFKPSYNPNHTEKQIQEWKEIGFKSLDENPDQAKELLNFLDSIALQYQDEETIPKATAFYLYDLLIDFMNEDNIVEGISKSTDLERSDIELFSDICVKIRNIFVYSKES